MGLDSGWFIVGFVDVVICFRRSGFGLEGIFDVILGVGEYWRGGWD